jgi:hypothetical protein
MMIRRVLIGLVLSPLFAFASTWNFFPQESQTQKELLGLIQKGAYSQSLMFWDSSLTRSSFARSATGQALYYYLMFQSGARTTAAEKLMSLKAPHHIHTELRDLWRSAIKAHSATLVVASSYVKPQWKSFLTIELYQKIQSKPIFAVEQKSTVKTLSKLASDKSTPADERPWYQWQLAVTAAHQDLNQLAKNQIDRLLESEQTLIDEDTIYITAARIAFQSNEFAEAIDWYKKVSKSSDLWLVAKEEIAWAYLRSDEPNKTISEVHTVLSPIFSSISGPEADFLSAFASLMICDYKNILSVTSNFKTRHAEKVSSLETLAASDKNDLFKNILTVVDTKPIQLASFSKMIRNLPRGFQRDTFLMDHMKYRKAMIDEGKVLSQLKTADSSQLAQIAGKRAESAKTEVYLRLQHLAKVELKEFKTMIHKLHLVEAEVIQRLHLEENRLGQRQKIENPVPRSSEILTFPVTKEVWLDEVDNYHAEVKDCPKITRASL